MVLMPVEAKLTGHEVVSGHGSRYNQVMSITLHFYSSSSQSGHFVLFFYDIAADTTTFIVYEFSLL